MRNYFAFLRSQWALLLFGFLCVFWGNLGQSFFLGWFGDAIKQDLGISAQLYGGLYSGATLASAISVFWLGSLIDRFSLSRFINGVSCGLIGACLLLYFSSNVAFLAIGFFLVRLFGQGLMPHAGLTTMARYFEQNRGKAISIASMGVSFGEVFLPMIAVFLLGYMSWQQSWLWFGVSIPLIFLPLAHYCLGRSEVIDVRTTPSKTKETTSGRSVLFKDYRFWLAVPTLLSMPFVLTAVFIHQDFILREKRWTLEWMATSFIVYGVVHWLSSVAFGVLVDKFSGRTLLPIYTLPLLFGLVLLANFDGGWVAIVMMTLFGTAIGASGPVVGALWAEVYGTENLGGIRSAVGALVVFSTSVSPILLGWFIDQQYSLVSVFNGTSLFFIICWSGLFISYCRK